MMVLRDGDLLLILEFCNPLRKVQKFLDVRKYVLSKLQNGSPYGNSFETPL